MTTRCGGCDARVIWTVNKSTKSRMPLNADPVPNGNIVLSAPEPDPVNPRRSVIYSTVLTKAQLAARSVFDPVYISHHATCPKAPAYRRTGG